MSLDIFQKIKHIFGADQKRHDDLMDAARYGVMAVPSKMPIHEFIKQPITNYDIEAGAEALQSKLKAHEEEGTMKERVTLFESPIYSDDHLKQITESLQLMGIHYEVKTEQAEAYKPPTLSVGGIYGIDQKPLYTIKVQTEKEKVKKEIHTDDGKYFHVKGNSEEPTEAAGYEIQDGKLKEVYMNAPATDGEPKEGVATFKTTDCAVCGAAPDLVKNEPNYFSEKSKVWLCEPHYIEIKAGDPIHTPVGTRWEGGKLVAVNIKASDLNESLPRIETLKAEINTLRAELDTMNEKGISPTEEELDRLKGKLDELEQLNASKIRK